jgi:hypothetical protein
MFAYMFSHEAHHRGQILMLAHQSGYRIPPNVWRRIWQWDRLWREAAEDATEVMRADVRMSSQLASRGANHRR